MRTGKSLAEGSHNLEIWQEELIPTLLRLKKTKRKKEKKKPTPNPLKAAMQVLYFSNVLGMLASHIPYHTVVFYFQVNLSIKFHSNLHCKTFTKVNEHT